MSKQDRQAVRTARDVEQKYNLGSYDKRIKDAKNVADDARKDVAKIFSQAKQEFQGSLDEAVYEMEQFVMGAEREATDAKSAATEAVQTATTAKETADNADMWANAAYTLAVGADELAGEAKELAEDVKGNYDAFDRRLQDVEKQSQDNNDAIADLPTKNWVFNSIYPVGSIYLAYNHTNPGSLFPGTEWVRIENAFPWFTGSTGTIGQTGGEREVTLTVENLPAHNHGGTYTNAGTARTHAWLASGGSAMGYDSVDTGGGVAHNNMPPYIQISAWRRTA